MKAATAVIDRRVLRHNLQRIRNMAPQSRGMHRLGIAPENTDHFYQRLTECGNVIQPVNMMSHFSRADEPESDYTLKQMQTFQQVTQGKAGLKSIAASGGVLLWPAAHLDLVRPR